MAHLYASFSDASMAEKAAGALLDHGVRNEDISIVANDAYGKTRETVGGAAGSMGNSIAGAGDRAAGAVTGTMGATALSAGYANAAAERGTTATYDNRGVSGDMDEDDASVNNNATDAAAKHGISTTTPEDAGEGAVKGTGVGLAVGVVAGLASLIVPGVGLVLGGGALAAALGGTALAAGAGAIAGGATGYLKDQGVPSDVADHYTGAVENGGAMLSLVVPSGNVSQQEAQEVLSKYGGSNVNAY